jgi:hypothetical protein
VTPAISLELVLRLLEVAARLGRAVGPAEAVGFFRSLFDGSLSADAVAEKAAAALSTALDVGLLAVDLEALRLSITTAEALAIVDGAVNWTPDAPPFPLPAETEQGFAALESALNSNGGSEEGSGGG